MKWINLKDRQPDNLAGVLVRPVDGIYGIGIPSNAYEIKGDNLYITDGRILGAHWRLKDLEWLDEEAYNIKDHDTSFLKLIMLQEAYDDLKDEYDALKGEQSIEESRCCEQNDKLRAAVYKLSELGDDKPLGDHFYELENKLSRIVSQIEIDYMNYRNGKLSLEAFTKMWL